MIDRTFDGLKAKTRGYYEAALAQFGDGPQGVNWRNAETQELRFQILSEIGDWSGSSVHDVGCGLAHLSDYLGRRGITCRYKGSDISARMIDAARLRLGPAADVFVADVLDGPVRADWTSDYVVNSGIFTVRGDTPVDEWRSFVESMLRRMFELCRVGIAFNMMTSYVDYEDSHLYYASPDRVLDYCVRSLSRRVVLRHDYPLWEYTVYVYR